MRRVELGLVKVDVNGRVRIPDEILKHIMEKFNVREVKFKVQYDEEVDEVRLIPIKEAKAITVHGEEIELI